MIGATCAATLAMMGTCQRVHGDTHEQRRARHRDRVHVLPRPRDPVEEPPLPEGLDPANDSGHPGRAPRCIGAEEPPVPEGLEPASDCPANTPAPMRANIGEPEPPLPAGLEGSEGDGRTVAESRHEGPERAEPPCDTPAEPSLPPGLDGDATRRCSTTDPKAVRAQLGAAGGPAGAPDEPGAGVEAQPGPDAHRLRTGTRLPQLAGFGEYRGGARVMRDANQDRITLSEARLHLTGDYAPHRVLAMRVANDVTFDREPGLRDELREASISFSPFSFLDIKVGRQILSWGTSTSLFINDLFAKDTVAFLLGRNNEQLRIPSDAVKLGLFTPVMNLEAVYLPRFNPDRFLTGDQLSFFNPVMLKITGRDAVIKSIVPDEWVKDSEVHVRLSRLIGDGELAAYGYRGFWKSSGGFDPATMQFTFPRLQVVGASIRDQIGPGIAHLEAGYYDSVDDRKGDDPFINNSEMQLLAGYEWELPWLAHDLTLGFEYYLETLMRYELYKALNPAGFPLRKQYRHVVVLQMVKLLWNQNVTWQLHAYLTNDYDAHVRSSLDIRLDDRLTLSAGANLFAGVHDNTFYGQQETNSNVYMAFRYAF